MQLTVGWAYRFRFKPDFSKLDGTYLVVKIYTYDELLEDNLDLFEGLYTHVGKTQVQLDEDYLQYRNGSIAKITNPDDSSIVYYIPEAILSVEPDPNVKRYPKLAIGINLGVCKDAAEVEHIKNTATELLGKMFGLVDDPAVFSVSSVWMTEEEYSQVLQDRQHAGREIVNYFGENQRLLAEVNRLSVMVEKYKEYIKTIASAKP